MFHTDGSWAILVRVGEGLSSSVQILYSVCIPASAACSLRALSRHAVLLSNVHRSSVPVHYVIVFYLETVLFKSHALDFILLTF